ncbi:MAG TPA: decaprenyl-phosphate phosphoribosyltransferase [Candidatus Desulfofervidus auxilii]|uniref:Decaprenyl-phosphate phosphoribosyltransferase n=1 Tax=Desulfofervidus auxilii TaxID=1621989 RepID=A0A7C2AD26_DESA2|nr:decaprenyl-phosphate phosphoribosyltransferase [Candidatus Desulfofervidus auxilii]
MIKEIIVTMRPKQWYKNFVIFAGIIFSLNLMNFQMWLDVISTFAIFCTLSGSEYIINDIIDVEKDRKHPKKCKRPIASGKLKVSHALLFAIILIIVAGGGAYLINTQFLVVSITYFLLILSYSLFLKHLILVDILVISIGFVIRAIAGCLAINVFISPWLVICAFLLALFLALGKRRHELILLAENAKEHRRILEGYSVEMLDQMISITTGALIISYSLYTFLADNNYMMLTIPLVIYGLFRYLFLVHAKNFGGETEMIFKDKGMVICMVLWAVLVVLILYGIPDVVLGLWEGVKDAN